MTFDQADFDIRCEWGIQGVMQLAPISDVVIIVDVLSFSTCVEIATARGAVIFPYRWNDASASAFAQSIGAELAVKRGGDRYSLSPASLTQIEPGTRLVLPSPNGSSLSLATGATPTLAGCLRNCHSVAQAAMGYGQRIAVVPAGERWQDGSLRPALEDWIGAGAIISDLKGARSPEAEMAAIAYGGVQPTLGASIRQCGSGKELMMRRFEPDVELAVALNVSDCVPLLINSAYINRKTFKVAAST
jgi:2-phosphosulfolactate phosphatase